MTRSHEPGQSDFVPVDLPDPEPQGPTIWAACEVRSFDSYRGYRAEYPTVGQAWAAVALIVFVTVGIIGSLVAWALQ